MDRTEERRIVSGTEDRFAASLAERYRGRGVARVLNREIAERIAREREELSENPELYPISAANRAKLVGVYRRGKRNMSTEDLLDHVRATHEARTKDTDFSQAPATDEEVRRGEAEKEMLPAVRREAEVTLPRRVTGTAITAVQTVRAMRPVGWIDLSKSKKTEDARRFPLAAFAALLAVAVSLMLIVASSVMVILAKSAVSTLDVRISREESAIARIRSDLNAENDLFSIRNVAEEEFGMIDASYLKTNYLSNSRSDSVTIYGREEPTEIGLSALMSALGMR